MPQKRKINDALRTIDGATPRPGTIKFDNLFIRIEKYLNWSSADPLADADRINDLLDEIRAAWRRASRRQAKEPQMVKDDPVLEQNAVLSENRPMRSHELDTLLADVVEHPENWMSTPSAQLGGRRPSDLVGTEEEFKIFDILHAVDQGFF
jgi:Protein of unknown function (DUF2384)